MSNPTDNNLSSSAPFDIYLTTSRVREGEKTTETSKSTIDETLNVIATKLLGGQNITESEQKSLKDVATAPFEKAKLTSTQKKIISTCKKLEKNILKSKGSYDIKQQHVQALLSRGLSPVEKNPGADDKAKAKTLLAMLDVASSAPKCFREATKIVNKKGAISENQLLKLINEHNTTSLPRAREAGSLAFQTGNHKVYYDVQGKLTLAPPDRKTTTPIELAKCNSKLKPSQVNKMKQTYHDIVDNTPYNNVGPMLEFMKFFRETSVNNSHLTLSEAFQAHQASPVQVYDKYHSGDCVILAGKLQSELRAQGREAAVTGQYTGPDWARPPVPNPSMNFSSWKKYDTSTENVHHCATVVRYSDEQGKDRALELDVTYNGADAPVDYEDFSSIMQEAGKLDTTANITNLGHILKMQMTGKSKMALCGKGGASEQFGIDLIRGNIYLNTEGAKGLQGLPLGSNGRFSISLQDLRENSHTMATYYVEGNAVQMTHAKALEALQNAAGERFQLPGDFSENILTLAENADDLVNKILISTVATAKQVSTVSAEAYNQVVGSDSKSLKFKELEKKENPPKQIQTLIKAFREKQAEMRKEFNNLQQAILDDDPSKATAKATTVNQLNTELNQIVSQIESEPIELANL